jgi:hypothetical protein
MEARARDGLWSVWRRNVSARSTFPFVSFPAVDPLFLKFFFLSPMINQHRYR